LVINKIPAAVTLFPEGIFMPCRLSGVPYKRLFSRDLQPTVAELCFT
jgi:hypothetical protein